MDRIKLLIVDDHAMFRVGIKVLLESYQEFEIVGEASNGVEAVEKTRELGPEVILMDIGMTGGDGLQATRRIKKDFPQLEILVLTMHDTEEYFFEILKAGFSSKRKQMLGNLKKIKKIPANSWPESFQKSGIELNARAEDITLENWKSLAKSLDTI